MPTAPSQSVNTRSRRLLPLATAIALASAGQSAVAQEVGAEESDRSFLLDRVTITGGADRIEQIPGSAQVLSREDLDRQGYTDPARILRQVPGVNVAEEEGLGQFPHISMRGVRPERNGRITVMEDNVLVGSPAPYAAPAAYYFPPMARMDSVEVMKGPSAIQHGPNTVGGAINMTSTPIPQETGGKIRFERGGRNSERTHAHLGGTEGQLGWQIETFSNKTDGFKELDYPTSGRQSGKPNNPKPETGLDRRNTVGKLRWNSDPTADYYQEIELKVADDSRRIHDSYLGLTEEDFDNNPNRRYAGSQFDEINTSNELYHLQHFIELSENTSLSTDLYRSETVRNWYKLHEVDGDGDGDFEGITGILQNPDDNQGAMAWIRGNDQRFGADSDFGEDARGNVRANNREYKVEGLQLRLDHAYEAFGWDNDLQVGVRYHEDEEDRLQWQDTYEMVNGTMSLVDEEEPGETTNRLTEAEAWAVHFQNTMERGPWTLQAGLRYEDISIERRDWDGPGRNSGNLEDDRPQTNNTQTWIPGAGAVYRLDDNWSVLAGYHRGFSPAGSNPDARTERSNNYEAGFRFRDAATRAEVIGFFNDYSNINIECTNVGGGCSDSDIGETTSAGEVDVYGLEALVLHDAGAARGWNMSVPLTLGYTFTESEFQQDIGDNAPNQWENAQKGDRIPEIPQHQVNLGVGVEQGPMAFNVNANYVSTTQAFADPELSDLKIDNRWLVDVSARYQLMDNVRLLGSVENATDETYIAHHRPAGLRPGAPRTAWAGIEVDF